MHDDGRCAIHFNGQHTHEVPPINKLDHEGKEKLKDLLKEKSGESMEKVHLDKDGPGTISEACTLARTRYLKGTFKNEGSLGWELSDEAYFRKLNEERGCVLSFAFNGSLTEAGFPSVGHQTIMTDKMRNW